MKVVIPLGSSTVWVVILYVERAKKQARQARRHCPLTAVTESHMGRMEVKPGIGRRWHCAEVSVPSEWKAVSKADWG
jgi:hypothetical protein